MRTSIDSAAMLELLARPGSRAAALVAVIALGALLRFAGISYEVLHPQHYDDRVFVNNVIEMLAAGDPRTSWTSSRPMAAGDWIELVRDDPRPLARVELRIANRPGRDPELLVFTREADGTFRPRTVIAARESVTRQLEALRPPGQVFVLQPEPAFGLRIEVADGPSAPWALGELELSIRAPGAAGPGN